MPIAFTYHATAEWAGRLQTRWKALPRSLLSKTLNPSHLGSQVRLWYGGNSYQNALTEIAIDDPRSY